MVDHLVEGCINDWSIVLKFCKSEYLFICYHTGHWAAHAAKNVGDICFQVGSLKKNECKSTFFPFKKMCTNNMFSINK